MKWRDMICLLADVVHHLVVFLEEYRSFSVFVPTVHVYTDVDRVYVRRERHEHVDVGTSTQCICRRHYVPNRYLGLCLSVHHLLQFFGS